MEKGKFKLQIKIAKNDQQKFSSRQSAKKKKKSKRREIESEIVLPYKIRCGYNVYPALRNIASV